MSASHPLTLVREPPGAKKPPAALAALAHRDLRRGAWWQRIPAYRDVDEPTFLDHAWQSKSSITRVTKLVEAIADMVPAGFIEDLESGMKRAPMSVRVSPYILPLDTCPVYCRFCTRSYAIGLDTDEVEKVHMRPNEERWNRAYQYIASRPELEDIVISGGDAYQLRAAHIEEIGYALLAIPHVRRLRFATKGPAVMPMKILTDDAWVDALTRVVDKGRRLRKDVVLHTHFNHPTEITEITEGAMGRLFERGVVVRNQTVLIRGVNDDADAMTLLVKRLGHVNVHPYYVYMHDMVRGVEDLRTSVDTALHVEKHVRGATAGFNTPTFVVDLPGGGGKRDIHSYDFYDRDTGISVYSAPSVKPGQLFMYFDPLHELSNHKKRRWKSPNEQQAMIDDALRKARGRAR